MSEKKTKPRRRRRGPQYKHHPFAVDVTTYSPDGSPVPENVLAQIEEAVTNIALANKLLVAVNRA